MASRRSRTSPALGPLEDEDLLAEILLRLPPKPSSLPRASLVCKRWRSIATNAAFRRRFRTHHRKPPILGIFFEDCVVGLKFMPLLEPPDRIPSERFSLDLAARNFFGWRVLGCRHGRVLLLNFPGNMLLVFEPVSRDEHLIGIPMKFSLDGFTNGNATLFCAAGGDHDHLHGECHSSPFKVVLVGTREQQQEAAAWVYSSETGVWGDLVSMPEPCTCGIRRLPCTLDGNSFYWLLTGSAVGILQFDLDSQSLTMIDGPPIDGQKQIIWVGDDRPGLAILSDHSFQLWDRKVDSHGVATWLRRNTVNIDEMLGPKANDVHIAGYDEDADSVFLVMSEAPDIDLSRLGIGPYIQVLVIVHLESMTVEKHRGIFHIKDYHPLTNFYTAGTTRT